MRSIELGMGAVVALLWTAIHLDRYFTRRRRVAGQTPGGDP